MKKENLLSIIYEFCRYILVGGSAFLIDTGLVWIFTEFVFHGNHIFIAVLIGYLVGLIYNFLLSCGFVFKDGFKKIKDKEVSSFIIFAIIGIIGLVLTEILMFVFIKNLNMHYMFAKIITAAIVMFWNYIARKVIIF